MLTFQGMRERTNYMMEAMRECAIMDTYEKWKAATHHYYSQGYDNGETTKYYKELEKLGANMDVLFELDLEIRDKYI